MAQRKDQPSEKRDSIVLIPWTDEGCRDRIAYCQYASGGGYGDSGGADACAKDGNWSRGRRSPVSS